MWPARLLIIASVLLILGVPFAFRQSAGVDAPPSDARRLIVITPHVPQIQEEFARAFADWHLRVYDEPAVVDFRHPGGTSDILKQLRAEYERAVRDGRFTLDDGEVVMAPGTVNQDVMFGGGSFDHTQLIRGITVRLSIDGQERDLTVPISVPPHEPFDQATLEGWFGPENRIGSGLLYHPEQYWFGTALSGFGIVYNREILAELGVPEPRQFADLADPRLAGWVALADPRQSGSITTSLESILSNEGWPMGWRILRGMGANTRYFTDAATKPPIDVASGEAAAGLAIDFYGRSQAQSVLRRGQAPEESRVGYIDPPGRTYIDADPVSILRGGPDPELAKRFVEFLLADEAQALWQFYATGSQRGSDNPAGPGGRPMGPRRHELRRMPARPDLYEPDRGFFEHFVDKVNPFEVASPVRSRGWRSGITPMMAAFAIDTHDEIRRAWAAIDRVARANPEASKRLSAAADAFDLASDRYWTSPDRTPTPDDAASDRYHNGGHIGAFDWGDRDSIPADWPEELRKAHGELASAARAAPELFEIRRDFYAFPTGEEVRAMWDRRFGGFARRLNEEDAARLEGAFEDFTPTTFSVVRESWRVQGVAARIQIVYTELFRERYRRIADRASRL